MKIKGFLGVFALIAMVALSACSKKGTPSNSTTEPEGELKITFTTSTAVGEMIPMTVTPVKGSVTIEGATFKEKMDDGMGGSIELYTLTAQTVTIKGDIREFYSQNAGITSIDVTGAPRLRVLGVDGNTLSSIDLSKNKILKNLYISGNNFETLDLSHLADFENLDCSSNPIKELDFSNNPKLNGVACNNTQVTRLDFSKNPLLMGLECKNNGLTSLELQNNPNLQILFCSGNKLTSLDLSKAEGLV